MRFDTTTLLRSGILLAALTASSAWATVAPYSAFSTWTGAVASSGGNYQESTEFNTGNLSPTVLTMSGTGFGTLSISGFTMGTAYLHPGNAALQTNSSGTIALPSGYQLNAALFGFDGTGSSNVSFTLNFVDGTTYNYTTTNQPTNPFTLWGFTSTVGVTSITVASTTGGTVELTDFYSGQFSTATTSDPAPTPEAATALLIGSGLIFLGASRKKFSSMMA